MTRSGIVPTMASRTLTLIADGCSYLECPRWHEGRLWMSDLYTGRVLAVTSDGDVDTVAHVPGQPAGLGWLPDGRLLVVSMRDRRLLRREPTSALVEHADLSRLVRWHLNDMVVDAQGRAYVGNSGFDLMRAAPIRSAELVRVDADGTAVVVATDLNFPNGTVLFPDGKLLVVAETIGQRLTAFDVADDGSVRNRRTWADFGGPPDTDVLADALVTARLAPDGICLDAEGAIWVADALFHRVLRVREGGEVLEEVATGDLAVFACMLGGHDGRTLYLCVAPSFYEHELVNTRDAKLLACRVDVPHAGLP